MAHLRRGGVQVETTAGRFRAGVPGGARDAVGHRPVRLQRAGLLGPGGAGHRQGAATRPLPFILISGEIGEDVAVAAMRNGASDYLLKANLARLAPAVEHAIDAHEARLAREMADQQLTQSRQRLSELAQHLQTSVDNERAAIAREIHDDVGGSLTALKFDIAWIARHTKDVRGACSGRRPRWKWSPTPSSPASGSCTTCTRPSWSRAWSPRCSGWPPASRSAPASPAPSAPATRRCSCRPACRWWRTGRRRRRSPTSPSTPTRRASPSTCRWPAACCRWRSATTASACAAPTSPRRAASASAGCTSARTRWAAGSTCPAASRAPR